MRGGDPVDDVARSNDVRHHVGNSSGGQRKVFY